MSTYYNPSRGGHAPIRLRESLHAYLDAGDRPLHGDTVGQLWNCTDTLPAGYCRDVDLPLGSTYAQAVRHHLASVLHLAQR
jgi:hypothetical protein